MTTSQQQPQDDPPQPGDATYDARHSRRNRTRTDLIVKNSSAGEAALDIGCNAGYFSRRLLEEGLAQTVDAIEFDPSIVPDDLKQDPRFTLHGGDAVGFEFKRRYHITVYGAVHHHLLGHHGHARATQFWVDVVNHTDRFIFIESGQLAEGSRWYWQRALRQLYSSDESYFADLAYAAGPRLKSLDLVGTHWLHGVPRWLLRFELHPPEDVALPAPYGRQISIEQRFVRTAGSKNQALLPDSSDSDESHSDGAHSDSVYGGVQFSVGSDEDGSRVFCKRHISKLKAVAEYDLARQIDDPRFITPLGLSDEHGLVSPFVDAPRLVDLTRQQLPDGKRFRRELLSLYRFLGSRRVEIAFGGASSARLIDVIDLHASNLFVTGEEPSLRVFDLEPFSLENGARNRKHFASMLLRWGPRGPGSWIRPVLLYLSYLLAIVRQSAWRPEKRILNRAVGLPGYVYVRLREALDGVIGRLVPGFRQ